MDVARVQPAWAELTLEDRGGYMRRAADVLLDEIDGLAELLRRSRASRARRPTRWSCCRRSTRFTGARAGPKILADEKIRYRRPS
jgi:acyl-CoA reductase-like NAD-dependent aldehyde dehydrogenase